MSSVQDHTPVIRELSDQTVPPQSPVPSDLPRATASDAPREHSPPRFSQLLEPLPEGSDPHSPTRAVSTGTNSVTLVNQPGIISNPNNDLGVQNPSVIRSQNPSIPASDRRPPVMHDPIRGDPVVQTQLSDDSDHGRGSFFRRVSVPRPRPIFNPPNDGSGSGNGSRVALRAVSSGDLDSHPLGPQEPLARTVEQRILPTLQAAEKEREKYKKKARIEGLLINGAIGLQVIVGAVTTGVAAGGKNIGSAVAVLGGISTGLASYLAKARGSGEPEFSHLRSRELGTFIREVNAFILDKGHNTGSEFDGTIAYYREQFELIIKTEGENSTSGTGYASNRGNHPYNFHPGQNQQQMGPMYGGGHGGGQYQATQPPANGWNNQLSEKQQMLKNEKAISGMV